MYTIKVDYETGDSFHYKDTSDIVGCCWKSKELARKALQSIKEHYRVFDEYRASHEEMYNKAQEYDWCIKERWSGEARHGLMVEIDDGSMTRISCFWEGYFETLYGAEIIVEGDDEDKFEV